MKHHMRCLRKTRSKPVWLHTVLVSLVLALGVLGCFRDAEKIPSTDASGVGKEESGLPPIAMTPLFISMADERRGFGLAEACILRTSDGGAAWTDVTPEIPDGASIGPAEFLDADTGWFVASKEDAPSVEVFRTVDGGRTWKGVTLDAGEAITGVVSLDFPDAEHGWILLAHGAGMGSEAVSIYKTADGGASWSLASRTDPQSSREGGLPFGGIKTGLSFADHKRGWLTGVDHSDKIWLYETLDGGETWEKVRLPVPEGYSTDGGSASTHPPVFFDGQDGFLPVRFGGENPPVTVFYATSDGGKAWHPTAPVTHAEGKGLLWSFVDPDHGFALSGDTLYSTDDGAKTWTVVNSVPDLEGTRQLEFVTPKTGWAAGDNEEKAFLLKTVDGGRTWEPAGSE
ncbi:MAG TPA: hypothetical protein GX507_08715 [Clostridia bacterium]|nr:hypothetical protein [Clostridia bacterium]